MNYVPIIYGYTCTSVISEHNEKTEAGETIQSAPLDEQDPQSSKSTTPTECCALLPDSKEMEGVPKQSVKLTRSVLVWTVCKSHLVSVSVDSPSSLPGQC